MIKTAIDRKWHFLDADGAILGRLASRAAILLRGKHKRDYTPHIDAGDIVVVTNAAKVKLTGNKLEQKKYYRFTGYPSGIVETSVKKLLADKPEEVIRKAVFNMLPKTKQAEGMKKRLKVYAGATHPHTQGGK